MLAIDEIEEILNILNKYKEDKLHNKSKHSTRNSIIFNTDLIDFNLAYFTEILFSKNTDIGNDPEGIYRLLTLMDEKLGFNNNTKDVDNNILKNIIRERLIKWDFPYEKLLRFSKYLTAKDFSEDLTSKDFSDSTYEDFSIEIPNPESVYISDKDSRIEIPNSESVYISDEDINSVPIDILSLFKKIEGKGINHKDEIMFNWGRYIEVKTWDGGISCINVKEDLDKILGHFHSDDELRNHEIENLVVLYLHNALGIKAVKKSLDFSVNFTKDSGKPKEDTTYVWYEINEAISSVDIKIEQINDILKNYALIKKYLSQSQQLKFGRIIYELMKKNNNLSSFSSAEENIKIVDFLFNGFSPLKDEYINEIFDKYYITEDMYNVFILKTMSKALNDNSSETNKNVGRMGILKSFLAISSKEGKREVLLWLLNDNAALPNIFKKVRLAYYKGKGEYVLNFQTLKEDFKMLSDSERYEVISMLLGGSAGLFMDIDKGYESIYKNLTYIDNFFYNISRINSSFEQKYMPAILEDFDNDNISADSLKEHVISFYEVFLISQSENISEKKKHISARDKILADIDKANKEAAKDALNNVLKEYASSTKKQIKINTIVHHAIVYYLKKIEKQMISNKLYLVFDLIPINFSAFDNYLDFLSYYTNLRITRAIIAGKEIDEKTISDIESFYDVLVLPVYDRDENKNSLKLALKEKEKVLKLIHTISQQKKPIDSEIIKKEIVKIIRSYKDNQDFSILSLMHILEAHLTTANILQNREILESLIGKHFIQGNLGGGLKFFNDVLYYEETINGLADIFFYGIDNSGLLKGMFKVLLASQPDEQKAVVINEIIKSFSGLRNDNAEDKAVMLGRIMAAMGANSGIAVIKILQIMANNNGFESIFKGKDGKIINEEMSKLKHSNDPLLKSTMFAMLKDAGILLGEVENIGEILGSASIAQSHVVTMKDGKKVVIKFKRPSSVKNLDNDLKLLDALREYLSNNVEDFSDYPIPATHKIRKMIEDELLFKQEAAAAKTIKQNMAERGSKIKAPEVFEGSNDDIIVQEFVEGEVLNRKKLGNRKSGVYFDILKEFFDEVFIDGFYHADLHDGNIMIDGDNNIWFIDFGSHGEISDKTPQKLNSLKDMFMSVYNANYENFLEAVSIYNADIYKKIKENPDYEKELKGIFKDSKTEEQRFKDLFSFLDTKLDVDNEFLMFFQGLSKIAKYLDNLNIFDKLALSKLLGSYGSNTKAILPENQEKVNNMIAEGKSPLRIATFVAVKEFFQSLDPKKFTLAHAQDGQTFKEAVKDNPAPLIVSLSGWAAFGLFLSVGLLLTSAAAIALVLALSIAAGASVNVITHIIIDYKYLKSSDLIEVVKQRGQAKIVNLKNYTVYVVNDMIDGEAAGISIDGVPVRISRINNSIVISADGIEHEKIVKAINNTKALKFAISDATGVKTDNVQLSSIIADSNAERGVKFEDDLIKVGYKDLLDYASQDYISFEKYAVGLSKIEREHRNAIIDKFIYLMDGDIKGAFEELLNQQDTPYVKLALSEKQYNDLVTNHRDIVEKVKAKEIEIFVVTEQSAWNDNFGFADGIIYDDKIYDYKTEEETDMLLIKNIDGNFNRKALEYEGMLLMDIAAIKEYSEGRDNLEINGLFKVMSGIMSALGEYAIGDISLRDIKKMLPGLVEDIKIKDEALDALKKRIEEAIYNKNVTEFIKVMEEAEEGEAVIIYLKDPSVSEDKKTAVMEQIKDLLFTAKIDVKSENVVTVRSMQTYRSILTAA
jgi:predicted unusual protein kinase regulating ubiquinone biosynthesis (AarF/ABC1/UbiB family)